MASPTLQSFDQADSLLPVPESSRKQHQVQLAVKVLETEKETRKILPEEKYVGNLEKLIVRDYFPELPKLKAQAEYMEALAKNDHVKIRELQIRYSTRRTDRRTSPSQRPSSVFDPDTPMASSAMGEQNKAPSPYANAEGDNESLFKKPKKVAALDKFTVQSYLDNYTSEDNASFEELAKMHNRRERVKNAWMYDAEKKHNESLVYRQHEMIEDADKQLVAKRNQEVEKAMDVDNWTYKARNSVLFNDMDEAPLTFEEYVHRSKQNEKIVNKEATRFKIEQKQPNQVAMARVAFNQASNQPGRVDITGENKGIQSKTLGLVATPTPAPGVDESPFMTWGEIEGTPFRLDAPDIPAALEDAPQFKIPEVPVREKIAADIADQIAQQYRNKRKHAMNQIRNAAPTTPKFNSKRSSEKLWAMSPAARGLAINKLGFRLGSDKLIKVSPSPSRTPSRSAVSPALFNMVRVKNEPKSGTATPVLVSGQDKSSVTDNLLRLPQSPSTSTLKESKTRPRAVDFF